jgi:hypothetical protein
MQTLEVIIPGKFYDSQIYAGRLYLWGIDSSLTLINWDSLVTAIEIPEDLKIALQFALQCGSDLYDNILMQDCEVEKLMQSKFERLSNLQLEVSQNLIDKYTVGQQNNPFPFPHADSIIYRETIFVGGQSGVSSTNHGVSGRKQQIEMSKKLFDMPILSISASHSMLAVAAGSEGLFDYSLRRKFGSEEQNQPRCLSKDHCNLARWLYPSIFGSSYFNEGYFVDFRSVKRDIAQNGKTIQETAQIDSSEAGEVNSNREMEFEEFFNEDTRKLTEIISSKEIFSNNQSSINQDSNGLNDCIFTWGAEDKICLVKKNSIEPVQYSPRFKNHSRKFKNLGTVSIEELNSEVISADSSWFGVILETEDGLVVITSSLETLFLEGELVNWRVFPKSKNYTNQLHVIHEDALHIYSFNHDYFVNQRTKKLGISLRGK